MDDMFFRSASMPSPTPLPWDVVAWERALTERPASYFAARGEQQALSTFRLSAARVPAYRDFLAKHHINPDRIRTIGDFRNHVPPVDKENYLRAYPLEALCVDGALHRLPMISASSGSTGRPFYWPRNDEVTDEGAFIHELLFRHAFDIQKKRTLVLVCFSMGLWIAGTYTLECLRRFLPRGYDLQVITPGIDMQDILPILQDLNGTADQILLVGYPPLIKDVVDAALAEGILRADGRVRFLFAGEGFSEGWREALLTRVAAPDHLSDSMSIYGTADAAVLGHETKLSNAIRKFCFNEPQSTQTLFGDERLPSLLQYHPYFKYVETNESNEILFTCNAGLPLVRYNIHDYGGVASYDNFLAGATALGFTPDPALISSSWKLPFVYVFGRAQFATSIYAVNIYLENVQAALADGQLQPFVSGKAVIGNGNDDNWDQYWWITVELARDIAPTAIMTERIRERIVDVLCERNSEFRRLYAAYGERARPRVTLVPYGAPEFKVKSKHRWNQPLNQKNPS